MAPEQIEGRPADARSDIYAFGAVMYEMATGTRAFGSAPRPLSPKALDRIVCGCLAPDPDERWQSAHDVLLQLAAIDHTHAHVKAHRPGRLSWLPWIVSAGAMALAATLWLRVVPTASLPPQTVRLAIPPPNGGAPAAVLKADSAHKEARLNWPFFLPDGKRFLYLQRLSDGSGNLMFVDAGKAPREVMSVHSAVQYVEPGYIVFVQERALVGRRFDPLRGTVTGAPFSIADPVNYFLTTTAARFAVSPTGTLAYQSFDDEQRLVWFDRGGREQGAIGELAQIKGPRLSPDERRVVFDRMQGGAYDVWETDLARQIETRLTFGVSSEGAGPWAPDGRSLFFNADLGAPPQIFRKNLATGEDALMVPASGTLQEPQDVSPNGRSLLFTQREVGGDHIWILPLDGSSAPARALATSVNQDGARFSRDGRYFSYDSSPAGRGEVYVSPFPPTGETVTVSSGGGSTGRWSRDGHELFYLSADSRLMSVPVQTSPSLRVGTPVPVFRIDPTHSWSDYDVSSTGRFLAVVSEKRSAEQPLTVVLNWTAQLDRRVQP